MNGPTLLGSDGALLEEVRRLFHVARDKGEFDRLRTEPTGAEWIVWEGEPGALLGYALWTYAGPGIAAIEPVWVTEAYRRRGIGWSLVAVAVESAERQGLKKVILGLTNENAAMRALTAGLGFAECGVIVMRELD